MKVNLFEKHVMCLQKANPDFNNHNKNKNENPESGKYRIKSTPRDRGAFKFP